MYYQFLLVYPGFKVTQFNERKQEQATVTSAKQFRHNQFSTSADLLFLLLFLKQSRRNQFSKWYGDQPTDGRTNGDQPTDGRTNGPTDQRTDQHSLL
jgi:hypothetical protein